jgi:hypothetical protein
MSLIIYAKYPLHLPDAASRASSKRETIDSVRITLRVKSVKLYGQISVKPHLLVLVDVTIDESHRVPFIGVFTPQFR